MGKIKVFSTWIDPEVKEQIKKGTIEAAALEHGVIMFRMAVDFVLRAAEGTKKSTISRPKMATYLSSAH